jgi:predicted patatin/cPLA2 family phospholipase
MTVYHIFLTCDDVFSTLALLFRIHKGGDMKPQSGVAAVCEVGGKRVTFSTAVEAGAEIPRDAYTAVFTGSAGAFGQAYHTAGQIDETRHIWSHESSVRGVYDPMRLLAGEYPANPRFLVQWVCRSLDRRAVVEAPTRFFVSLVRVRDGEVVFIELTKDNIDDVLIATSSIPRFSEPWRVDGELMVDGGIRNTIPVWEAYFQGYRRILVLGNRPKSFRLPPYHPLAAQFWSEGYEGVRRAYLARASIHAVNRAFLESPPPSVKLLWIAPPREVPCKRMDCNADRVARVYDLGFAEGRRRRQEIQDFLAAA